MQTNEMPMNFWARLLMGATATMAVATMAVPALADREIASHPGGMVATVPSGEWCAPNVPVTIHAPNRESFREGSWHLREFAGTIRNTVDRACAPAETIIILGRVDGQEVYRGRIGSGTGNQISGQYVSGGTTTTAPPRQTTSTGTTTQAQRIRDAQTRLNRLGYNAGAVDGLYGPRTRSAVERFQRDHNIPVDGRVTQDLISALTSAEN